jgi:hypothetical protein
MLDRDVAGVILGHVDQVGHDLTAQIQTVLAPSGCLANNSQSAVFILMDVD